MATAYPGGNRAFSSFSYTQQVPTGGELFFSPEGLEATYKDFKIGKEGEYQLYYIKPIEGKVLPLELSSRWTKLGMVQQAIDKYHEDNPEGIASLKDYVELVKRDHHKKKETLIDETNNSQA